MSENIFTVWITKYALTTGIFEKEVEIKDDIVSVIENVGELYLGEGKVWHRTKESAVKHAEEMRLKKIVNMEKQLQKLKDMKFE